VNSPPPKPEVILTNFFAEPTVLLVAITSRVNVKYKQNFIILIDILKIAHETASPQLVSHTILTRGGSRISS
jgi:hypothetical protein